MTAKTQSVGVKKKRWVACFDSGILDMDLSIYEKMTYIVLCSHAKKDGPCFPSVNTIAREASCSRAKVFEALKRLEEIGAISRSSQIFEGRGQTSNLYEILDINPPSTQETGCPQDGQGETTARTGASVTQTGVSTRETGGVQDVDGLYKVLELSHMNNTKELNLPPTPQGAGEEKTESENEKAEEPQKPKHDTEGKAEAPKPSPESELFEAIRRAYNHILPELPKAEKLTASRAKVLRQRIRENPERKEPDWWKKFFPSVRNFPWPMGQNRDKWRADFDWFIGERGMQKILEGSFQKASAIGECAIDSREFQKKYTDSEGRIDARAMLRDIERASAHRQFFS
ncbi:MAG: helix-turn-helix domain-containing protein [Synergistaceae bacterium]|nr:helix-turn-helix domain-containing protein [Synergistaceae bacterium]